MANPVLQFGCSSMVLILGLTVALSTRAQTLGDVAKGREYAQSVCAACHNVLPGGKTSPIAAATPFQAIADTSGMTGTALTVFFRTPHKSMPNLIIAGDNADNIIAYILSLKDN
ncbi:MAG: c-type cytochrome [Hyphomicrobiaceae bacterium]